MVPALTGTGSKPPAASTLLHSFGSFAMVRELRGLLAGAGGCKAPAIAALLSFSYQLVSSCPQPSSTAVGLELKSAIKGVGHPSLCRVMLKQYSRTKRRRTVAAAVIRDTSSTQSNKSPTAQRV